MGETHGNLGSPARLVFHPTLQMLFWRGAEGAPPGNANMWPQPELLKKLREKQPKESIRQQVRKGEGRGEQGGLALCPQEGRLRRPGGHGASFPTGPATLGRSPGALGRLPRRERAREAARGSTAARPGR